MDTDLPDPQESESLGTESARNSPSLDDLRAYRDVCAAIIGGADASAAAVSTSGRVKKERTWLSKWLPRFCESLGVEPGALVRLPERKTERVTVTASGREFLGSVVKFLSSYEELTRATRLAPSEIAIGTWHWFSVTILTRAAPLFQERLAAAGRPPVGLRVYEYASAEMMRDLSLGLIDVALGGLSGDLFPVEEAFPELERVKLDLQVDLPLVAIAPKGHEWKRPPGPNREVGLEQLADELVYLIRHDLDEWLPRLPSRGSSGCRVLVSHYVGVLAAVLASGKAPASRPRVVGIVPKFGIRRKDNNVWEGSTMPVGDLDVFGLTFVNPMPLDVWCKSPHQPSPVMQLFEQCIRDVVLDIWHGIPIPPVSRPSAGTARRA